MTPIPEGDYYDCHDSDELTFESPEEAIGEYLDMWMSPDCDAVAVIRERSPVTVTVHRREVPGDDWIYRLAGSLRLDATEEFAERYGNPDFDPDDFIDEAARNDLHLAIEAALRAMVSRCEAWSCEKIAEVDVDAATVEAMMREHNPEWFEGLTP